MSTFNNFVQCRVTTPITAVADSIGLYAVVPPYSLPSEEGGLLVLTDSPTKPSKLEVISYTSRSALGLYGVTRGLEGTTALEWSGPVYCYQSLLAGEFKTLLDSKVDKVAGKQLSDTNFTQAEKTKLGDIALEATKNRADSENADKLHPHTMAQVTGLDAALTGKASNTDSRFTDARDWTAATITQAEAETGTATTRRAFTAQRVRQGGVATVKSMTVQETGTSTTNVMSQNAVTEAIDNIPVSRVAIIDFGTMSVDQRKVLPNPFGNNQAVFCMARAEVRIGNVWHATGFIYDGFGGFGGFGISAHSVAEGIVVQTGSSALNAAASESGGTQSSGIGASAPVRAIVHHIGGVLI